MRHAVYLLIIVYAFLLSVVRGQTLTLEQVQQLEASDNPEQAMTIATAWLDGVAQSDTNSLRLKNYQRARKYLKVIYDSGATGKDWVTACRELGNLYKEGKGVLASLDIAEAYLIQAHIAGDEKATRQLAEVYANRDDAFYYSHDIDKLLQDAYLEGDASAAFELASRSRTAAEGDNWRALGEQEMLYQVALGNVSAIRDLAKIYRDGGYGADGMAQAIELFELAISKGDIQSVYTLGKIYADVTITQHNPDKAAQYLRQAAQSGRLDAALFIATSVPENQRFTMPIEERREWLEKAVETGAISAKLAKAKILLKGGIFPQDTEAAGAILDKIIKDVDIDADELVAIGQFLLEQSDDNTELKDTAITILERAKTLGASDAYLLLADYYIQSGNQEQIDQGLLQYEQAAALGESRALLFLGDAYRRGNFYTRDISRSAAYYQQAAETAKSKDAMVALADLYLSGEGGMAIDAGAARYWLEQAARQNSRTALLQLGKMYNEGRFVPRNVDLAIDNLERAANEGSNSASILLADIFTDPATRDEAKAEQWLRLAWERKRSLPAGLRLAELLSDRGSTEAIDLYKELAEAGEVDAVVALVQIYLDGTLIDVDVDQATIWTNRAEELGRASNTISLRLARAYLRTNDPALHRRAVERLEILAAENISQAEAELARAYRLGTGVDIDMEKSVSWTRRAAEQSLVSERLRLAGYYETGMVVPQDYETAKQIYLDIMSSNPRNQKAPLRLALLQRRISRDDTSLTQSVEYLKLAAENGSSEAQFALADAYTNGAGVPQDGREALNWLIRARDGGEKLAYVYLGRAYASGFGVPIDPERAFNAFYEGAEQGSSEAMAEVGRAYIMGFGTEKNVDLGVSYMRQAASLDNASAMYELGELYRSGIHVTKNINAALEWYRKAAALGNMKSMINIGFIQTERGRSEAEINEAKRWLQRATDLGHTQAPRFLKRIDQGLPAAAE